MSKAAQQAQNQPPDTSSPTSEPSWRGDVELTGVWFQSPMSGTAQMSLMLGNSYRTGMGISGLCKRITLMANTGGIVRATIDTGMGKLRYVLFFPGGAFSEVAE